MLESEIVALVSNVGFPIAVTVWFMFRTEKIINANTDATRRMIMILESEHVQKTAASDKIISLMEEGK